MPLLFTYDVLTSLAAAPGAAYLAARPKHRPLLGRFAPRRPDTVGQRPIWLQACSVGEVNAARPILEAMAARWPDVPLLLTTSTISGKQQAETLSFPVTWFPFDHRLCVRRFLDRIQPRMLVLLETEVWPNAIRMTRQAGIPVAVLNGRISDEHYPGYWRLRRFWRPVFADLSAACVQNEEYAERMRALGAPPDAVHVTGCTKFEGVRTEFPDTQIDALREAMGIPRDCPVVVFGSVHTADIPLAVQCWAHLRDHCPDLRLVLVPRHIERTGRVCAAFDEPLLLRSETLKGRAPAGERVLVVDVMGELCAFYALASIAVICDSFRPKDDGHNPLESAALGIPTVFGPYMSSVIDPVTALLSNGGALEVTSEALPETLRELLDAPERRERLASNGRAAVSANRGAVGRSLALLERFLDSG